MDILLSLAPIVLAGIAGAVVFGLKAASPDATTAGRVGFGTLAALLAIVAAAAAFAAYFLWSFANSFTF
jgi:hypothetical protein